MLGQDRRDSDEQYSLHEFSPHGWGFIFAAHVPHKLPYSAYYSNIRKVTRYLDFQYGFVCVGT